MVFSSLLVNYFSSISASKPVIHHMAILWFSNNNPMAFPEISSWVSYRIQLQNLSILENGPQKGNCPSKFSMTNCMAIMWRIKSLHVPITNFSLAHRFCLNIIKFFSITHHLNIFWSSNNNLPNLSHSEQLLLITWAFPEI